MPALTLPDTTITEFKGDAFNAWVPQQTCYAWCSTTGTTVTMNDQAWISWNNSVSTTTGSLAYNYPANSTHVYNGTTWIQWNVQYAQETEEQQREREASEERMRAEWARQREVREREAAERKKEREAADQRAQELLLSMLTPEQRESYLDRGWFEVRGSRGGRWRIRNRGQSGNVDLMPEIGEERDATFCAHPPDGLPAADAHLAQMLALVTDEDAFVRTANVHYRRPGWTRGQAA